MTGSLTDTNAQLLIKISQLEEDNRAMSMDLKSMELKSCEDLDSLRVEIAALNGKLKAANTRIEDLQYISRERDVRTNEANQERNANETLIMAQNELSEAQRQLKQKEEVIKMLQDQLNVIRDHPSHKQECK